MSERDNFEVWYCQHGMAQGAPKMEPEEIKSLRDGDYYGDHRVALNSKWESWQGRAVFSTQQEQPK